MAGILIITSIISLPSKLIAVDSIPPGMELIQSSDVLITPTKESMKATVYKLAKEYGVNPEVMINVINCENTDWIPGLQSRIITKTGEREKSYGLAQIHLPSHPHITIKQASSPEFAIEFMAKEMSMGKASKWSCYNKIYKNHL